MCQQVAIRRREAFDRDDSPIDLENEAWAEELESIVGGPDDDEPVVLAVYYPDSRR